MKIAITSGGTREYIDEVRVLTNISSGKLGSIIADRFMINTNSLCKPYDQHEIHYIYSKGSICPERSGFNNTLFLHEVTDVKSLQDTMEKLVPDMNVVIHCMAVSDFGFRLCSTKLKSNSPEDFIESLKNRIYQTPKILSMIKKWNPDCKLISFKFEVDLKHEDLIKIATDSGIKNGCDLVIANDKKEMQDNRSHIAYAIDIKESEVTNLSDKKDISNFLFNYING